MSEENYIAIMDATGDTKHKWLATCSSAVESARNLFKSLLTKGYLLFKVPTAEEKAAGETDPVQVREFSPTENYVAMPPMQGG